ncbi:glutathione S-transferase family protein [Planktomarina sp.]|uniref:glutathione S-transferase family protein n=1 Tax=Planktomarina sp. TaxID=2024851 RepID=UPI00288C8FA1|nr:glutathione S-transferase family protein [Planktomarina sp.]MDT2069967.1 glutathione S-transferase family protein [Planktomarina sp.]
MKLIMAEASPFARKVRVLLRETNQLKDVEEVNIVTSPFQVNEQAKVANPTGRIPSLSRADGPALYDSRVITRYLDAKASAGLYPEAKLWDVLTVEATGDSMMDSAVSISYELRLRPEDKVSTEWTEAQWAKAMGGCDALQSRWMDLLNGPLTMAHISVACALGYLDLRHDARNWRQGHDVLAAWLADFSKRSSFQDTHFDG